MLDEVRQRLSAEDLTVAEPVFGVDEASIDHDRSSLSETDGFVRCRFVAVDDVHCPFEMHFGRGKHEGRFNFFIGRGAEVANYEPMAKPEELAADLRNFLKSNIVVEGESRGDAVVREEYTADRMVLEGAPLRFFFAQGGGAAFSKGPRHHREYRAWVGADKG